MAKKDIKIIYKKGTKNSIGHVCVCGKEHKWPGYVYAHFTDEIIHTCDCGVKVELFEGNAYLRSK